jgi:hypothetical protein
MMYELSKMTENRFQERKSMAASLQNHLNPKIDELPKWGMLIFFILRFPNLGNARFLYFVNSRFGIRLCNIEKWFPDLEFDFATLKNGFPIWNSILQH